MKLFTLLPLVLLCGCEIFGYTSVNNHMTGQVKKVHHNTPILCGDYASADVSLGVIQNGVGSVSDHDVELTIENETDVKTFEQAADGGKLVDVTFKERRATWCIPSYVVTSVSILGNKPPIQAESQKVVHMEGGHEIVVKFTNGEISGLLLDGANTPLDSAAGKAALLVLREQEDTK